jgi:hypothetical protein
MVKLYSVEKNLIKPIERTLSIKDPYTGLVRTVYDLTTGIYDIDTINHELESINRRQRYPVKAVCIEPIQDWQKSVEELIRTHVKNDLLVDPRQDGFMEEVPMPETIKELSGTLCVNDIGLNELHYNNAQLVNKNGCVYTQLLLHLPYLFSDDDRLVIWHTHPSCSPHNPTDVNAFKEISILNNPKNPENCFDVRYIPKMQKFYWFTLDKKTPWERFYDRFLFRG